MPLNDEVTALRQCDKPIGVRVTIDPDGASGMVRGDVFILALTYRLRCRVTAGIGTAGEECRGIMTVFGVLDRVLTRRLPLEPPDDPHAAILPTPIDND
ncbi:hypothetical protein CH249_26695, partial [Rhodococcus sp. 05-2255-3B1]